MTGLSPRVRGNQPPLSLHLAINGSIPACAGKLHANGAWSLPSGSIPACAGEPYPLADGLPAFRVYPRVCGGTARVLRHGGTVQGLSPRVRGNQANNIYGRGEKRSIPACAGEPRQRPASQAPLPVYPRVCGGTWGVMVEEERHTGLSPRVRGNQVHALGLLPAMRSIPACAGEPTRT